MNPWSPGCATSCEEAHRLVQLLTRFWRDESGATAVEYGLILAGIFLTILTAAQLMGERATGVFIAAAEALVDAMS